jgi:hypothetical protein
MRIKALWAFTCGSALSPNLIASPNQQRVRGIMPFAKERFS